MAYERLIGCIRSGALLTFLADIVTEGGSLFTGAR